MKSEDWEGAIAKCDEALKLDPSQELARDKRQRAEAERKNRAGVQRFMKAADESDYDSAVASYGEVAEDSVYRQKGSETLRAGEEDVPAHAPRRRAQGARRQQVRRGAPARRGGAHRRRGQRRGAGHPEELRRGGQAGGEAGVGAGAQAARREEPDGGVGAGGEGQREADEPRTTPPTQPNPAAEKMLQDAQDAYVHGQYANAIETAKKAAKSEPLKAWRIIGAASCFLKDRNGAMQAWNKLGPQERSFLKYVCSRNAITVP